MRQSSMGEGTGGEGALSANGGASASAVRATWERMGCKKASSHCQNERVEVGGQEEEEVVVGGRQEEVRTSPGGAAKAG